MHTRESDLDRAERCRSCGAVLQERQLPNRPALLRYCPVPACALFGLPRWRQLRASLVVDGAGNVVPEPA